MAHRVGCFVPRHFKQEVTPRVYDNAFKICISAGGIPRHESGMQASRGDLGRSKNGISILSSSLPTGNKPETASEILRNLREPYGKRNRYKRRGVERDNNTSRAVLRSIFEALECDTRETFVRGKVKLVGGKKRRDKKGVRSR